MNKLDTRNWERFTFEELSFECLHGKRIKKSDRQDGNTIFLTAGKENNGVVGTIGNNSDSWECPITVDMFGNAFFHPYICFGDDNVYAFINGEISNEAKMFMATCVNAETSKIFSYVDQFRQTNADKLSVLLPVSDNGPDWEYMEEYIKKIELKESEKLIKLKEMFK